MSVKSSHIRAEVKNEPVDVVILTNGPGEVATWVKPVVARLRRTAEDHAMDMRISVCIVSPKEWDLPLKFSME